MKKYEKGILVLAFVLFMATASLLLLTLPKSDFLESENRYSARMPAITAASIAKGGFGEGFESWLCDAFPFREQLVCLKSQTQLLMQNTQINGVYVGSDGRLFEGFDELDEALEKKQQAAINLFNEKTEAPVYFAIAPNSIYINASSLPQNAPVTDQGEYIRGFYEGLSCRTIDLCERLMLFNDEYLYYKTDHHWTSLGSFYAYEKLCEDMRVRASKITEYKQECVSSSFYGTLFSKGNFLCEPDSIYCFRSDKKAVLSYDNGAVTDSFYYDTFLQKKDKYAYFLGGNPAYVKISSTVENGKTLVVLGDSYLHCMAPFLASSYETVYLLDLRYINKDITDYVNMLKPTQILILYNAKTLSEDRNILKTGL